MNWKTRNVIQIVHPVQRKDVDEQAMVIIDADLYNDDYYVTHIENETGDDITYLYSKDDINKFSIEAFEIVNQERNELPCGHD